MNKESKHVEQISQERVRYIIDTYCNGNRMEFSKKTGIGKSSISQYVNGTNAPGSLTASKIGDAFGLNPMWIMGFDAPKKASFETMVDALQAETMQNERARLYLKAITKIISKMNDEGKTRLLQYAEDIADKYKNGGSDDEV